jgi:glycerophosphoryl diester phosphodiesterase
MTVTVSNVEDPTQERQMLGQLWNSRRRLITFALWFQLFECLLFTPAMGLLGGLLTGRPVVDSTALVAFFLSPRGLLVLFLGAIVSLTIRLVEHAGLSALVLGAVSGKSFAPWAVFRWLFTQLPRLTAVGSRIIGLGVVTTLPLLASAGLLVPRLLKRHDINYYLANRPSEFTRTVVIIGLVALMTILLTAWLWIRWRLVVQVCIFDRRDGRAAFREAAAMSRGAWPALAGRCLAMVVFLLVVLFAATGLQRLVIWLALHSGLHDLSLPVSFGILILLHTVLGAGVVSLGACGDAIVFTLFYQRRRRELGGAPELPAIAQDGLWLSPVPAWAKVVAAAVAMAMVVAAGASVAMAVNALNHEGRLQVTAHRGGHKRAPENTAAAIREAIDVGADFAEIDVLLSKDEVLVVTHDSDFSRMGGVAKKVWELTFAEIRAIPLGAKSAPEFHNEPAPTLDEVLAIAHDRIRLNIELKYYGDHQPRLAERVLEAVRSHGMTNQVVIQSLNYEPLLQVRRLAPEIPIGYLMSVNARHPERMDVDFLGVQLDRVTGPFVEAAHRRGQQIHAWTVDTPAAMDEMIDLGVDGLITNEPAEASRHVRSYEALSQSERTLRRIQTWLKD